MFYKRFLFTTAIFYCTISFAQKTNFQRTYGGFNTDQAISILQTKNNNYFIAGESNGFGSLNQEIVLIKTNVQGGLIWSKTIGTVNDYDYCKKIKEDFSQNLILAGNTQQMGSKLNMFVIKLNQEGSILWQQKIGSGGTDELIDIAITPDNCTLVVGASTSFTNGGTDIYITKLDSSGNVLWGKNFGDISFDIGHSICTALDGNYLITGETRSYGEGESDVFVMKVDTNGKQLWFNTYGTAISEVGKQVIQLEDSTIVIAGEKMDTLINIYTPKSFNNIFVMHTSPIGVPLWTKSYGGLEKDVLSFLDSKDSTIYFGGYSTTEDGNETDGFLITTNLLGDTTSIHFFGKDSINDKHAGDLDYLNGMTLTNDSCVIMVGTSESFGTSYDFYVIKTDDNFTTECFMTKQPFKVQNTSLFYDDLSVSFGSGYSTLSSLFSEDDITFHSDTMCFFLNPKDSIIISLPPDTIPTDTSKTDTTIGFTFGKEKIEILLYPNPARETIHIELNKNKLKSVSIINNLGEILINQKVNTSKITLNTSRLNTGIYILKIEGENFVKYKRVIIQKE